MVRNKRTYICLLTNVPPTTYLLSILTPRWHQLLVYYLMQTYHKIITSSYTFKLSGLYYGIKNRRTMSVKEMLLGGKDLGSWPVSLSLVGTLASTIFVLGVPSEVYYGGEWPLYLALAFIPATVITVHIFIPIFHSLGVTSAYEVC